MHIFDNLTFTTFMILLIAICLPFIVLYYIIKNAIRNGIEEARGFDTAYGSTKPAPENFTSDMTLAQAQLYERYKKNEITFDEYQKLWNEIA